MSSAEALTAFRQYDFDSDQAFGAGLRTILESMPPETDQPSRQRAELAAKVFYFNRVTGSNVEVGDVSQPENLPDDPTIAADSASAALSSRTTIQPEDDAPYPPSFARLAELITSNQTDLIPNNELIPDRVEEGAGSASTQEARRKPWENNS